MKTSKKLLSFFLAVVMVVTTCSVGFTAFAQDNRNSIWSTSSEAEDAFNALNDLADEYLPSVLMGIDLIANPIYEKHAKELGKSADKLTDQEKKNIADNVTLPEILGALQPVLLNTLEKTSKKDFLTYFYQEYYNDKINNLNDESFLDNYNYLDGRDADMSYYTLLMLCIKYADKLDGESKKTLEEWRDKLLPLADLYEQEYAKKESYIVTAETVAKRYGNYSTASLYDLEQFFKPSTVDGKTTYENVSDEELAVFEELYKIYGPLFEKYADVKFDSPAKVIYHIFTANQSYVYLSIYYNYINLSGAKITFNGKGDFFGKGEANYNITEGITPDNCVSLLVKAAADDAGISVDEFYKSLSENSEQAKSMAERCAVTAFYNQIIKGGELYAYDGPYYLEIIKGYAIDKGYVKDAAEIDRKVADLMPEGWGTKDCVLTDEQLADMASVLASIRGTSNNLVSYYNGESVSFNDKSGDQTSAVMPSVLKDTVVTEYLKMINAQTASEANNHRLGVFKAFLGEAADRSPQYDSVEYRAVGLSKMSATTLRKGTVGLVNAEVDPKAMDAYTAINITAKIQEYSNYDEMAQDVVDGKIQGMILPTEVYNELVKDTRFKTITKRIKAVSFYTRSNKDEAGNEHLLILNFDPQIGSKNGRDEKGNIQPLTINGYFAEAENYGYTKIIAQLAGINSLEASNVTKIDELINIDELVENDLAAIVAESGGDIKVVLTPEQEAILNGDYDLIGQVGTDLLNTILNDKVLEILDMDLMGKSVTDILNSFLETPVELNAALKDIWARLVDSPVATLFELMPILVVLIDELVEPVIFNNNEDKGLLYSVLQQGLLATATKEVGSYIGIDQLRWDLNELLPDLMHWLLYGKESEGIEYYDQETVTFKEYSGSDLIVKNFNIADLKVNDFKNYTVVDTEGNPLKAVIVDDKITSYLYMDKSYSNAEAFTNDYPDVAFNCSFTYESSVPRLTGIYVADKALRDAEVSDLEKILSNALKNETTGKALGEVITEIATLFTNAVDTYVNTPELRDQIKCEPSDANFKTESKGLNNIFVAIPQLFDLMENLAADKYSVDKNAWVYCYDGKIFTNDSGYTRNASLEKFKSFAGSDKSDRSVDILDCFADIFVNDWINAVISLVNNTISTDNKITQSIPIISNLLAALGGFGKTSIITDVINGVFQVDRNSKFSFTFEKRDNGFTGLSKDNAYFLLSNIKTLITAIENLVNNFGKDNGSGNGNSSSSSNSSNKSPVYKPKAAKTPAADKSNYTKAELSNTTDLINNLDKMISSLLSDSSLNGFKLNDTTNIFAGIVTFFSNYLGNDCYTELGKVFNSYVFYITGSETHKPDSKGNVNAKKVYTNDSLTGLVVETFLLIENIVENLLSDFYDTYTLDNGKKAQYNLLVEAIEGLISPDAVGIRLDGYDKVQKKLADYNCWHNAAAQTSRGDYKIKLDWGIKAGDKDAFYDGLAASLRLVTSILSVILIDTNWYGTVVSPILNALCEKNGIKIDTAAQFKVTKDGYHDEVLLGIIKPVSEWLNLFLNKPATTLIKSIQGIAGLLDDKHGATIASILKGAISPLVNEVKGLGKIFAIKSDELLPTSLTLQKVINDLANKLNKYSNTNNIKLGKGKYTYPLSGSNLIPIINSYLASTEITLKQINWYKLSTAKTPAGALVYFVEYLLEVLLDNSNLAALADLIGADIVSTIIDLIKENKITAKDILSLLNRILEATDSPTLAYWTFSQYLQKAAIGFYYPAGVTKQMADNGVDSLDQLISAIFPLLSSFGVDLGGDNLQAIIDKNLFKNSLVTTIATALYGALDGLDPTIKNVLKSFGIVTSTKDVAKILTDKSYGKTFTAAAKTIRSHSSWKNIKNINWGFKDGSEKAQQGFVNALAAVLRPLYNVLNIFLNEGTLKINEAAYNIICSLNVPYTVKIVEISNDKKAPIQLKFSYRMKDGVLRMKFREYEGNRERSRSSELRLDFKSLKNLKDLKIEGTNGYNSAIIPLLEALQCSNISSYAKYRKDVAKAKDNLLLDILNPLIGDSNSSFLNKLAANPIDSLTKLLPNVAMYLDSDGLIQLVSNLLAPITDIAGLTGKGSFAIGDLIEELLGAPLQDMIIPLVNMILSGLDNPYLSQIQLADINWNALISLGTKMKYTSKATGANGKYLTGKKVGNVDQGKVLITVLRYIANLLVNNSSTLKNLICSIDAVAKNDMIKSIVASVFNTIGTASPDQIIAAVFYLLDGHPQNAFWDYTSYKTGTYSFSYPENMDVDFLKSLPPMLDGLIGSLIDLNETISKALFKDSIISSLATGLYGAIEGVKINDNLNLTQLLAQTNIDFSTSNVANLLVDERYGQKFENAASVISAAGSWANVNKDSLKWGVTDRDSFFHALVAVLRPLYGVLDVLLNDAYLGLFDIVRLPGSNGYSSSIVPLMEAFSMYNIKTQYQYRQDMSKEYDAILLDIINPLWDKVEDILAAPLQTVAAVIPNLALFIGNNGLCQIIDNLLTPVSALVDAIRPVVDLNSLLTTILDSLDVDLNSILSKIGVTNFSLDIYDLNKTLKPILGADAIIPLVNSVLGMIKIKGTPLGLKLNDVDWLQLASHGTTIVSSSQAATFGPRVFVQGDSSETLIAVLRYLINTINSGDNFDKINSLIGGLLGDGVSDSVSNMISQVLGILQNDTDTVISQLVELLEQIGS